MPHPPARRIILLHHEAPPKPALGAACNGCGVCCATDPCPLGMFISRRRHGACAALLWSGAHYRCGAVSAPERFLPRLPRRLAVWPAHRWIASAHGCDADVEPA